MTKPKKITSLLMCLSAALLFSCGNSNEEKVAKQDTFRGVYYWRTSFKTDSAEKAFLAENRVGRMYVRFFDVDVNPDKYSLDTCMPVATITFADPLPKDVEIVPTVFITAKAIVHYNTFTQMLARRIYSMCELNDISPREIQFDCDWNQSTVKHYFDFLKKITKEMRNFFPDIKISSTIRLHQLSQTPPPVDKGVLMCYNTGNFRDFNATNSILDTNDVKPYLKHLKNYALPMDIALPVYAWNVEFDSEKQFSRLNAGNYDFSDTTVVTPQASNLYKIHLHGEKTKFVRHEAVSAQTILRTKKMLLDAMGSQPNIILYHLDSEQLSKYTKDEITEIYR